MWLPTISDLFLYRWVYLYDIYSSYYIIFLLFDIEINSQLKPMMIIYDVQCFDNDFVTKWATFKSRVVGFCGSSYNEWRLSTVQLPFFYILSGTKSSRVSESS